MDTVLGIFLFILFLGGYSLYTLRKEYDCPPLRKATWEWEWTYGLLIHITWPEKMFAIYLRGGNDPFVFVPYERVRDDSHTGWRRIGYFKDF